MTPVSETTAAHARAQAPGTTGTVTASPGHRNPAPRTAGLWGKGLTGLAIVVLVALPLFLAAHPVTTLTRIIAFAVLVLSVNLLTGITGLPTLGQAAYFGAGGYTAVLVGLHITSDALVQLLAGTAAALLVAAATGWVTVRARGIVFLMLTLAIGESVHQIAETWKAVGGSNGLAGMPPVTVLGGPPLLAAGYVYWWVLGAALVIFAAVALVIRSPYGRTLRGIRDNEPRMRALGYRPALVRFGAFCLAGAVAGAGGALWVAQARFFSPGDLGFEVAVLALLSVVIGGAGSLWGPCVGAAAVLLIRDQFSASIGGHGPLLLGLLFVAAVYLLPRGLAGVPWLNRRKAQHDRGEKPYDRAEELHERAEEGRR